MKGVLFKACVHNLLTYGAETLAMKVGVFQRLRAIENAENDLWSDVRGYG